MSSTSGTTFGLSSNEFLFVTVGVLVAVLAVGVLMMWLICRRRYQPPEGAPSPVDPTATAKNQGLLATWTNSPSMAGVFPFSPGTLRAQPMDSNGAAEKGGAAADIDRGPPPAVPTKPSRLSRISPSAGAASRETGASPSPEPSPRRISMNPYMVAALQNGLPLMHTTVGPMLAGSRPVSMFSAAATTAAASGGNRGSMATRRTPRAPPSIPPKPSELAPPPSSGKKASSIAEEPQASSEGEAKDPPVATSTVTAESTGDGGVTAVKELLPMARTLFKYTSGGGGGDGSSSVSRNSYTTAESSPMLSGGPRRFSKDSASTTTPIVSLRVDGSKIAEDAPADGSHSAPLPASPSMTLPPDTSVIQGSIVMKSEYFDTLEASRVRIAESTAEEASQTNAAPLTSVEDPPPSTVPSAEIPPLTLPKTSEEVLSDHRQENILETSPEMGENAPAETAQPQEVEPAVPAP